MHVLVLRDLPAGPVRDRTSSPNHVSGGSDPRHFVPVAAMFTLASLASGAFTANLMPALGARGVASGTAAILGGLIGVMQLPGRVLLMSGVFSGSPATLLSASLLLHAAGLGLVAAASSTWVLAAGTAVFALGAGLTTLVRPHLIQTVFGVERGGYLNGRVARQQQFARAGGPILLAWLGGILGYGAALAALAGVFALAAVASREALGVTTTIEREAL
jgi:uncharacterized membrane protein (UPF0136 family)